MCVRARCRFETHCDSAITTPSECVNVDVLNVDTRPIIRHKLHDMISNMALNSEV